MAAPVVIHLVGMSWLRGGGLQPWLWKRRAGLGRHPETSVGTQFVRICARGLVFVWPLVVVFGTTAFALTPANLILAGDTIWHSTLPQYGSCRSRLNFLVGLGVALVCSSWTRQHNLIIFLPSMMWTPSP